MTTTVDNGRIAELVRAGLPLKEELVIDCHQHMGRWPAFVVYEGDADGMVRTMDRCGIDAGCVSHHAAIGPDTEYGNTLVAEACARFPGRFIGYCCLNGRHPAEVLVEELERYMAMPGFGGIKVHPAVHQYPLTGPNLRPAFELAAQRGWPVLTHTWQSDGLASPAMIESLATELPELKLILGHTGGVAEGADEYLPVARRLDNVYCDLTGSLMNHGMIEVIVREVGAERVLFGSDLPMIDCHPMLGYIAFARIPDDAKRRILGLNAAELFGRGPAASGNSGENSGGTVPNPSTWMGRCRGIGG